MKKIQLIILLLTMCSFTLCGTGCAESGQAKENEVSYQEYLLKEADLPQIPRRPDMSDPAGWDDETRAQYEAWWQALAAQQEIVIPDMELIQTFTLESSRRFAADHERSNFLYSPVSLWFCLNTLSDLTAGDSQAQIQAVLGLLSEENRDAQRAAVFRSLYWEDDESVCAPAISVWLNRNTALTEPLLARLASAAYSSVFRGTMGEASYDTAFQLWLNEHTRGLLQDSVSDLRFSPDTGLSVCSTLYLKSGWTLPFSKEDTAPDTFYSESGELTADYMHSSGAGVVFRGDGFTATTLELQNGGSVMFLLPEPGLGPEELLNSDEVFRFLFAAKDWEDAQYGTVNLAVPKMDCLSELSLRDALEAMGITDIFDPQKAQFTAELSSDSKLAVSSLQQYARLILNEEGVEAAAITLTSVGGMFVQPGDEIDFTLNRPFLYAVMSEKEVPLFIGTYHRP